MLDPHVLLLIAAAVFVSAASVGYAGFGFNLMSVPLLTIALSAKDAVILVLVVGSAIYGVAAFLRRSEWDRPLLLKLLLGSLPGVAIGAGLFTVSTDAILRIPIAIVTLLFAVALIFNFRPRIPRSNTPAPVTVGAVSGVLASSTGMSGPPVVMYLFAALDSTSGRRATIVGYLGCVSVLSLSVLGLSGQVTLNNMATGLASSPAAFAGLAAGNLLFRRFAEFHRWVSSIILVVVAVSGLLVLFR